MHATRLSFRSRYLGKSHFDVFGGPMHGKTVTVTDSDLQMLERSWGDGTTWNITRAEYERDVLGGAGMIVHLHSPVSVDVMDAYKALVLEDLAKAEVYAAKHSIEDMGAGYFAARRAELDALATGYWKQGWHRTEPVQALPLAA